MGGGKYVLLRKYHSYFCVDHILTLEEWTHKLLSSKIGSILVPDHFPLTTVFSLDDLLPTPSCWRLKPTLLSNTLVAEKIQKVSVDFPPPP